MNLYKKILVFFALALTVFGTFAADAEGDVLKVMYSSTAERFDNSSNPKIDLTSNVGHARVIENFDDEHGNVLNLGVAEGDANAKNDTSQINISNTGDKNKNVCFEFDIFVDGQNLPAGKRLSLIKRNSSTSQPKLFEVDGSKFYSGGNTYNYTPGKWYTVIVNVDMENSLYGVSVNDGESITVISENVSQEFSVSTWRFFGTTNKTNYHEFYLDNFKFYKFIEKPDGYEEPSAQIEAQSYEKYYGENIDFTLDVSGTDISSAEVYINDEFYADYESFPAAVSYTPSESGQYTVKAVVKNTYGITGETEKTFTVNSNEPPSVTFDGMSGEVVFEEKDDKTISVTASDDYGIAKLELYVNGNLANTVNGNKMTFDLSALGLECGKYEAECIAYDIYNLTASEKLNITLWPDGYVVPSVKLSAKSKTAVCGEKAEFTVKAESNHFNGVDVFVNDELYKSYTEKEFTFDIIKFAEGDYKIKAVVKDILGKEAQAETEITYSLPSGYIPPSVSITAENTALKLGETIKANVLCEGTHYQSVDVFVDGELKDNYEQESFNVFYTPKKTGTCIIKAVITDLFGKTDQKELKFTIADNDAPTVSFDGISDGGHISFSYDLPKAIKVSAADSDQIDRIEIYVDGVLKKTHKGDSLEFDFDQFDMGLGGFVITAVAYDAYGLDGKTTAAVEITNSLKELKIENTEFDTGVSFTVKRGHALVGVAAPQHGKSILIGMAETDSDPEANYSSVNITSGGYNQTEFVFDMCVIKKPSGKGLTFAARTVDNGTVKIPEIFTVNDANFVSGGGKFAYEVGKWYTVSIEVNFSKKIFSTIVYDGESKAVLASGSTGDFGTFSNWRFYTSTNKTDYCEFALDNFKFYEIISAPGIESVGYDDKISSDIIPTFAKSINITLNGSLEAQDINIENVRLLRSKEQVYLEKVQYDRSANKIILILKDALISDADYSVVIDKNVRISQSRTLGADIKANFKTGYSNIQISGINWKIKKDNSANLTFDAKNLSKIGESEYQKTPISVIVTLWNGDGRFVKTCAKDFSLSEAEKSFSFDVSDAAGLNAEIYFANNLNDLNIYEKNIQNYKN